MAIFAGLGTFGGMFFLTDLIRRYKRPSVVVFALGIILVVSTAASGITNYSKLKEQVENGENIFEGDPIC